MIDHLGFAVSDIERSRAFYEAALAPLGIALQMSVPADKTEHGGPAMGFGTGANSFFWIAEGERVGQGTHVAFAVERRDQVDAFHAAGGKDNGGPGPRPLYGPNYYAAFVYDPDGFNVEAVCRAGD